MRLHLTIFVSFLWRNFLFAVWAHFDQLKVDLEYFVFPGLFENYIERAKIIKSHNHIRQIVKIILSIAIVPVCKIRIS